jgi:tRNA-Thr(GGU) m(6)t(6)A37 methyltransferase TsaA
MHTSDSSLTPIALRPIGVIRSPHTVSEKTPIQPVFAAGIRGTAELQHEYTDGLVDLEGFSHLWLIYVFHQAGEPCLTVKPFLDDVPHGVFATRAPCRPNPIGMSLVRLVRRDGPILHLEDVDVLDGTPLLDIKPYVTRFDVRDGARCGWQERVDDEVARQRGRRGFKG